MLCTAKQLHLITNKFYRRTAYKLNISYNRKHNKRIPCHNCSSASVSALRNACDQLSGTKDVSSSQPQQTGSETITAAYSEFRTESLQIYVYQSTKIMKEINKWLKYT